MNATGLLHPADTATELMAFTGEQAARLSGLTPRQLRRWERSGLFPPQYSVIQPADHRRGQLYSFRDIVGLRVIAILRSEYGVPLRQLGTLRDWLRERCDVPWSSLRLYVAGRSVGFNEPAISRSSPQHTVVVVELEPVVRDVRQAVKQLRQRNPADVGRTAHYRGVMQGHEVLAGTRIPTATIRDFWQAGYDAAAVLQEYPQLAPEDIEAVLAFEEGQQLHQQAG